MTARDVGSVRTRLTVGGKNCFRHVRKGFYLIVRIRKPPGYLESGGKRRRSSHTGEFLEGKGSQWLRRRSLDERKCSIQISIDSPRQLGHGEQVRTWVRTAPAERHRFGKHIARLVFLTKAVRGRRCLDEKFCAAIGLELLGFRPPPSAKQQFGGFAERLTFDEVSGDPVCGGHDLVVASQVDQDRRDGNDQIGKIGAALVRGPVRPLILEAWSRKLTCNSASMTLTRLCTSSPVLVASARCAACDVVSTSPRFAASSVISRQTT